MECPGFELVKVATRFADVLPELIAKAGVRRLAFEADHATFADVQEWAKAAPEVEWAPTKGVVMKLRSVKDAVGACHAEGRDCTGRRCAWLRVLPRRGPG